MTLEGKHLGQYRLLRLLGSGGMGEVYLAEDARIGQKVAIKVSKTEVASYPSNESTKDAFRLFQREAKAIAQLDHPRILPLYSYGEEHLDGMIVTYIVMPYRHEGTLAAWLPQRSSAGVLPIEDVIYFIRQAADALQYAHDNRIVHQDVKPSNFLIRTNKEQPNHPDLLLADFGIAKLNTATVSTSQTIRGTPAYMSPEQWRGKPVPATDQYALAVLAYNLLTGRLPFSGRQEQLMYQHFSSRPRPPSDFNPDLPKGIDAVILKALEKRPADRFPSIAAFAQALQQATSKSEDFTIPMQESVLVLKQPQIDETVPAVPNPPLPSLRPPPAAPTAPRQRSSSRTKIPLLISLVLLILLGSVGYFYIRGAGTTSTTSSHTSTATAPQTVPYAPPNATPIFNDAMNGISQNNQGGWETPKSGSEGSGSVCQFTGRNYEVKEIENRTTNLQPITFCLAQDTQQLLLKKFHFQVQMTIVQGDMSDNGGLHFTFTDKSSQKSYYFGCSTAGQCTLSYFVGNTETPISLPQSFSSAFLKGHIQTNILAVEVQGGKINLYVNTQLFGSTVIGSADGGGYGYIGVFADEEIEGHPTVVDFSNVEVWSF